MVIVHFSVPAHVRLKLEHIQQPSSKTFYSKWQSVMIFHLIWEFFWRSIPKYHLCFLNINLTIYF